MKKIYSIILIGILSFFLFACEMPAQTVVTEEDLQETFATLFSDVDIDNITSDLTFKTRVNGITVTYVSGMQSVIANNGKVTRGEQDEEVEVTITLKKGTVKYTDTIVFTVLKKEAEEQPVDPIDQQEALNALDDALNNLNLDNFRLLETLEYDGEWYYDSEYFVADNLEKYVDTYEVDGEVWTDTYYFVYDEEGKLVLSLCDFEGEFFEITNSLDYYLYYADYYLDTYLFDFDSSYFEYVNGRYFVKNELLPEFHTTFLGLIDDGSVTFFDVEVTLKNGQIESVVSAYDYYDEEEDATHTIICTLNFKEFGTVELTLPEYKEEEKVISDIYEMAKGDEVTFYAIVAGYLGQNVYVTDGEASIVVYFKNASYLPDALEVGKMLAITGTVDIYNNLYEVVVASGDDVTVYEDLYTVPSKDISDLSTVDEDLVNWVVNLNNVKLSTLEVSSTKDTSITLTDLNDNTMTLFVKKAQAQMFLGMVEGLQADTYYDLENVVVSIYKTNLQIVLTEQTKLSSNDGFFVNPASISVLKDTDLTDALAKFSFAYVASGIENSVDLSDVSYETSFDGTTAGTYQVTFTYLEEQAVASITVYEPSDNEVADYDILADVTNTNTTYKPGLPSTGDVNVLVIPIAFDNSPTYDLSKLEIAFNSTNGETGWYSLKEYYQKVSYGNLNISATILEPYQTNENYSFKKHQTGVDDYRFFTGAISYYDDLIDYSLYDQNSDGYLDCVYLIYLAPVDYAGTSPHDMYWAYVYEYFEEEEEVKFDGVGLDYYLWASIEFFDEPIYAEYDSGGNIIESESVYVNINCETIIHESGHALGLDDYYDYDSINGPQGGTGGLFMMDYNQGDHDPFSKAILGWINPYTNYNENAIYTLNSFEALGDAIMIKKNNTDTYFDEYYMVAYYTPTGVNEFKKDYECGLISTPGIMIIHIDATLAAELPSDEYGPLDIYQFNNGTTDHKLIMLVEADGHNDIEKNDVASDSDLFQAGDSFTLTWYDGTTSNITVYVTSIDDVATVSVVVK